MDLKMTDLVLFGNDFAISSTTSKGDGGSSGNSLNLGWYGSKAAGIEQSQSHRRSYEEDDGCELILGLGPTPNLNSNPAYSSGTILAGAKKIPSLTSDVDPMMFKLSLPDEVELDSVGNGVLALLSDEGSTSARSTSGGYMPSLLLAPRSEACDSSSNGGENAKKCRFDGCRKGARGATGLCIAHGGGHRCLKPGCRNGAESKTAFCKSHGGGRRCQMLGCTKSAEGKTEFCIAHGGGRRCEHPSGCGKAARGKSGLCIRHGGGKRCSVEGCARSAEGQMGLCISHGGGRRCQQSGCSKGAQGSTMYCKAHGGGKRCAFEGCTKGAEGSTPYCKGHGGGKRCLFQGGGACPKSVHGGTDYCVAHGGGKRCAVAGCTKSARGRTDCCVRHGGGKRCSSEGCAKSAQGSTDFCKAHGGGKRCQFGSCDKFARGRSGLCASHSSMVAAGKAAVAGRPVPSSSGENGSAWFAPPAGIPRGSVGFPGGSSGSFSSHGGIGFFGVPEGRVHGGGLMSLLRGDIRNAVID